MGKKGAKKRPKRHGLPFEDWEDQRIIDGRARGETAEEIGEDLGRSVSSIRNRGWRLASAGKASKRPRGGVTKRKFPNAKLYKVPLEEVQRRFENWEPRKSMAKSYGVSDTVLTDFLTSRGIKRPFLTSLEERPDLVTALQGCQILGIQPRNTLGRLTVPVECIHVFQACKAPERLKSSSPGGLKLYYKDKLIAEAKKSGHFVYCLGAKLNGKAIALNVGKSSWNLKYSKTNRIRRHQQSCPLELKPLFIAYGLTEAAAHKLERQLLDLLSPHALGTTGWRFVKKDKLELFHFNRAVKRKLAPWLNNPDYHPDKFLT